MFENICKSNDSSGKFLKLPSLSQTRWTVRQQTLYVIIQQFMEIITTLQTISDDISNTKVAAEASGVMKLMFNFEFFFCVKFLHRVLSMTDLLSKELQSKSLDIISMFPKIETLINCFSEERNYEFFKKVLNETEELCEKLAKKGIHIAEQTLPRKRKIPKKLE